MLASGQVTHALATRITGLASGARVSTDRAWPWAEDQLPAWRVVEVDEDVEPVTVHAPTLQQHQLQVELQATARDVEGLDDTLRSLVAEALTAVFDTTPPADDLAAIAGKLQISLRRIERFMAKEGEAAVGRALITLRVGFRTYAHAPETLLS